MAVGLVSREVACLVPSGCLNVPHSRVSFSAASYSKMRKANRLPSSASSLPGEVAVEDVPAALE